MIPNKQARSIQRISKNQNDGKLSGRKIAALRLLRKYESDKERMLQLQHVKTYGGKEVVLGDTSYTISPQDGSYRKNISRKQQLIARKAAKKAKKNNK